jgi:membrane-associated phospholipid phosphatase
VAKENATERDKEGEKKHDRKQKFDPRSSRFLAVAFPALYAAVFGIFCLVYDIIPGPEFLVLCAFIYAAYNNWSRRFVKDWVPFVIIFLSYEVMYGVVGTISKFNLHTGPHNLEYALFGSIPSLVLQQTVRSPILDYMGAFFYSLHFFAPTIFGLVLWRLASKHYWKYTISLGILTYSSLTTFLAYPVAPPWIAVHGVARILTASVDKNLGIPVYKTLFDYFGANQYAAFPSLHSALPWLIFLFAFYVWKWKSLPVLAFPIGVWFSAVYLGEHYVLDVLAGIAYATMAFVIAVKVIPYVQSRKIRLRKPQRLKNES